MSDTPKSDAALARADQFWATCKARMEVGKREYGDSSFDRPVVELIEEIQQELRDTAVWSFIQHDRLEEMREKLCTALQAAAPYCSDV